ncbi:MAG: hypothetical protein Q8K59_01300, partial [Nitrosomonas sp.]|nr:hypothetical protein [Nitrosomonas sp.]
MEWKQPCEPILDWSAWLAENDDPQELEVLRRNAEKGLPCGADKFIRGLEKVVGRPLHYRPLGRPKKEKIIKGSAPFSIFLKTQGYHFEHNFGHGYRHLSTVFACLMMLAFLVDQV